MRSTLRVRMARVLGAGALIAALLLPAAAPVAAADPVVLRVGTVQDLDAMNPYLTEYFIGWEVFGLNYDLLVGFGQDAEPIAGFAKSWTQDGTTWTFKIDPDLKWSDGTAGDVRGRALDAPDPARRAGQRRVRRRRLPRPLPHLRRRHVGLARRTRRPSSSRPRHPTRRS